MAKNDFQYGGWNSYTLQCGTITTLISSGDCTLQCGMWLWNRDSEFTKWQHPAMWYVALGWHAIELAQTSAILEFYIWFPFPHITAVDMLRPHFIILALCKPGCKPGFRPDSQPGFRQVRAGLRHAFDTLSTFFVENLVANLLFAAGSLVCARARQMKYRKITLFEPANEPVEAKFS